MGSDFFQFYRLCRGFSRHCHRPKHFILHFLIEYLCLLGGFIIINSCGVNIPNFLIETLFRESDITYTIQPFIKIVPFLKLFQAVIIHSKALDDVLFENNSCQDSE